MNTVIRYSFDSPSSSSSGNVQGIIRSAWKFLKADTTHRVSPINLIHILVAGRSAYGRIRYRRPKYLAVQKEGE